MPHEAGYVDRWFYWAIIWYGEGHAFIGYTYMWEQINQELQEPVKEPGAQKSDVSVLGQWATDERHSVWIEAIIFAIWPRRWKVSNKIQRSPLRFCNGLLYRYRNFTNLSKIRIF